MKDSVTNKSKPTSISKLQQYIWSIFIASIWCTMMTKLVFASGTSATSATIWVKASEIMKDVYTQIMLISTISGIVTAAVALLLMNFSKDGRTVDESRAWLKRIVLTWVILNSLGFIMAYITPFFAGGQWSE